MYDHTQSQSFCNSNLIYHIYFDYSTKISKTTIVPIVKRDVLLSYGVPEEFNPLRSAIRVQNQGN